MLRKQLKMQRTSYTQIHPHEWFRLCKVSCAHSKTDTIWQDDFTKQGNTFLLHIFLHTNNTVFGHTFLINHSHLSNGNITLLASPNNNSYNSSNHDYQFNIRLVANAYDECYIDIIDNISYHATVETDPKYYEAILGYTITMLSVSDVEFINQYTTEEITELGYKVVDSLQTHPNTVIVPALIEKKLLNIINKLSPLLFWFKGGNFLC